MFIRMMGWLLWRYVLVTFQRTDVLAVTCPV